MGTDIKDLPDTDWTPVSEREQSRYSEGLCNRCGGTIACGERHLSRGWKSGPATWTQHLDCFAYGRARGVYIVAGVPLCDACIADTADPAAARSDIESQDDSRHCRGCDYHADPDCFPQSWCVESQTTDETDSHPDHEGLRAQHLDHWTCRDCDVAEVLTTVPSRLSVTIQRYSDDAKAGWVVDIADDLGAVSDTSSRFYVDEPAARAFAQDLADLLIAGQPVELPEDVG